ncbi:uncharacterized protein OCT59_013141 [Rhizophagus irregularis]|uniref:Uncharacterized protein n=5 Tax=Rhizophagus irregularis TaxID=588596 RepID=A0A915Z969_9GLOM|nr:hypothetical protein RirG_027920 [Rhizophagus irregularis DAOM 197198w]UZO20723.1 hypothetical protein OCT59_013141 [Rhizophagus irregularis]GBC31588.1 hypothetical protein GLOIN_2v1573077 [Rhizophagus irregularis DAOM 181602=DAOM 197198]CAB4391725.1 unnamed protein product [Rhizophagus irregularis]CAB4477508.1 unnamed protein product [Rhizophagus irregularis]
MTRQTSMINQICTQIDDLLQEQEQTDKDIVKISLDLDMSKIDEHVLEAIHYKYVVEIIGNDIFIKYDGVLKEKVHVALVVSAMAHNQNWIVVSKGICVVAGDQYLPDVGVWFQNLTRRQQQNPIISRCPPPDVWVEVFYDKDSDRSNALNKIALVHRQRPRIEFVGVALPNNLNRFGKNPNPQAASTAAIQHHGVPGAPYLIHWNANFNRVYYRLNWNLHVVLRCGWTIEFNHILKILS